MPDPVRSAPAHPLALAAAALILLNDFGLRGHAPGWLTGKLSDVGWLVVAPVLIAALLARIVGPRRAKAAAIGLAGGFYIVLQVWAPLGAWFRPDHVADLEDLLVLPALLGALYTWRPDARRASPRWASRLAVPGLAAVLLADDTHLGNAGSAPCREDMEWDAAEPLRFRSNPAREAPVDTDGFARGVHLRDESGAEVPFVLAASGSTALLCARDGLRGDTDYTWQIGPWTEEQSNERRFQDGGLPTVLFHTLPGDGPPVADAAACAALQTDFRDAYEVCNDRDTGARSGS
ncbi:MAG: hypothetical protein V4850_13530 [Myxococcota bacterium]